MISIREPNHIQVYPVLITDGIYVTFNLYYYPHKINRCIVYTPGEPSPVKTKIRQCDMDVSDSSLLKKKGTEYSITHYK